MTVLLILMISIVVFVIAICFTRNCKVLTTKDTNSSITNTIYGTDKFVSKSGLNTILQDYYKKNMIDTLIPKTWKVHHTNFDSTIFDLSSLHPDTVLIAKKNIQQQTGLLLFRQSDVDINFLKKLEQEQYVVIQIFLKDPFIIDNRKTNIRVYVLVVVKDFQKNVYLYNDGFMYYTPDKYKYGTEPSSNITTGYIDREVYIKNPLTLQDLFVYLRKNNYNDSLLLNNIKKTIKFVMAACVNTIQKHNDTHYQLFGIDLQFDNKLDVKLIEINKSPNLKPHDNGRDSKLKRELQKQILGLVGISKEKYDNFFMMI